jgi:hypothetical protein
MQVQILEAGKLLSTKGDWTLPPKDVRGAVESSRRKCSSSDDLLLAWRRLEDSAQAAEKCKSCVCLKEILKVNRCLLLQKVDHHD